MSFDQIIKGTLLPKIPLKTLFEEDTSFDSKSYATRKPQKNLPSTEQETGANSPFIKIGGQVVTGIELMTIDETNFIPTISLTFRDNGGEFAGDRFPKTDLIMNVYLKVSNDRFKPIRCDFLITSMKSLAARVGGTGRGPGIENTYIVKGELYIPNIYANVSKSYPNLTSKQVLKKVCDDLGLGFAENGNSDPADKMTWINPNTSTLDFIKTVINYSYLGEDSFFTGFIDKYYILNFIEVNQQLRAGEAQETFVNSRNALSGGLTQNSKDSGEVAATNEITVPNFLSTQPEYLKQPNYIKTLDFISDQGTIIKKQGYKKQIYYYDHLKSAKEPKDKFTDFFMEPLRSQDRPAEQYLIPSETSLAENKIKKWMNIDYGNNHTEFNAARLLNSHNLQELEKVKLKVSLNGINFQAIRGFVIPVIVTVYEAERVFKASKSEDEKNSAEQEKKKLNSQAIDNQLSGFYYIHGAKYHYDITHPNGLYTELILARREWTPSKKSEVINPVV